MLFKHKTRNIPKNSQVVVIALCAWLLSACGSEIAPITQSNGPQQQSTAVTTQTTSSGAAFGFDLPPFQDIVLVYEFSSSGGIYGLEDYPIMRFTDGTFTKDLYGVLYQGIDQSKRENPYQWGQWQGSPEADTLMLKVADGSFEEVYASNPSIPVGSGFRLNKCYTSSNYRYTPSTALGETDTTASYNTFCFQQNGLFTNDTTVSSITAEYIAASSGEREGYYEIDGNVIRITYGNGTVRYHYIGVYSLSDDPQFNITLDANVFRD